jgi:hypothetical protein
MGHVVLLGDSIFDNARYVPGGPAVIDQLRHALPRGWRATLLAIDGDLTPGVPLQLARLPSDATQLFVSTGGNDALMQSGILPRPVRTVADALTILHDARQPFRRHYRAMLDAMLATKKPTAVCTVYDAIPGLGPAELAALACFNEVILYEAARAGVPLIDLRLTCNEREDYSAVSSIEPSTHGGAKIARAIAEVATKHDFSRKGCTVYV